MKLTHRDVDDDLDLREIVDDGSPAEEETYQCPSAGERSLLVTHLHVLVVRDEEGRMLALMGSTAPFVDALRVGEVLTWETGPDCHQTIAQIYKLHVEREMRGGIQRVRTVAQVGPVRWARPQNETEQAQLARLEAMNLSLRKHEDPGPEPRRPRRRKS